jgi:hypothetical protein
MWWNLSRICLLGILLRKEFQAFLSWFSRKRLLLDHCENAGSRWRGILSALRDCTGGEPIDWRGRNAQRTAIRNRGRGAFCVLRGQVLGVTLNDL